MKLDGTDIKQVLTGLRESQIMELEKVCDKIHRARSEVIREAVDLWLRAYNRSEMEDASNG